jgi:hypothetical protein
VREWLKANGGPPGLIMAGIGLFFAFWPVGAAFVALGVLMWLNASTWFPWKIAREYDAEDRSSSPLTPRESVIAQRLMSAEEIVREQPISGEDVFCAEVCLWQEQTASALERVEAETLLWEISRNAIEPPCNAEVALSYLRRDMRLLEDAFAHLRFGKAPSSSKQH